MAQAQPFTPEPFGSYLLLSHLGRGGMADVYKARMEGVAGFARYVVVKRILDVHTQDPHFVEMFINEAKIAARLYHPNIVQVYDLGEVEGELFMAMEYVRGRDLLRLLRATAAQGQSCPPPQVGAFIVREVARALAHAHEHLDENNAPRPIIHRDVSPQNVMIGFDGQVKLVDFGIAKAVSAFNEGTHTGSLKGKIGYMAPEQIDTGLCTPQTDIFSAGVVLHEVLTGRRLFKGSTDFDTLNKVKSAPLLPPSSTNPQVSGDLDKITLMALDRNPETRYQRAAQLSRDLDMYLQGQRFSVEDAAAWLREVFPREDQEEGESEVRGATPSRSRSRSHVGPQKRPNPALASTLQVEEEANEIIAAIGSIRVEPREPSGLRPAALSGLGTPTPSTPARAVGQQAARSLSRIPLRPARHRWPLSLLLLIGAAVLCSGISVLWVLHWSRDGSVAGGPSTGSGPGHAGSGTAVPVLTPPQMVSLDSEPSGATVYAGPKVLGRTPLHVDLQGDSLQVTLALAGRPDLVYTIRRSDGNSVVLRLPPEVAEVRTAPSRHDRHGHHGKHDETPTAQSPLDSPGPAVVPTEVKPPVQPPVLQRPVERRKLNVPVLDDEEGSKPRPRPID